MPQQSMYIPQQQYAFAPPPSNFVPQPPQFVQFPAYPVPSQVMPVFPAQSQIMEQPMNMEGQQDYANYCKPTGDTQAKIATSQTTFAQGNRTQLIHVQAPTLYGDASQPMLQ